MLTGSQSGDRAWKPRYDKAIISIDTLKQDAEYRIEEVFDNYLEWIQETMTTERTPWLKVSCAMVGNATEAVANSATLTTSGGAASDNA